MRLLVLVPVMAALIACPPPQAIQPPVKQPDAKVNVTVLVILASDRCQHIDDSLKNIAAQVRKEDPDLTGFTLSSMIQNQIAVADKGVFECIEGQLLTVTIHHGA